MKVWCISFIALFAMLQLSHWLGQLTAPMPGLVMGGVLLSLLSNLDGLRSR
jgi:putative effector of murein hydrolase LrgA (UPF0299 family)